MSVAPMFSIILLLLLTLPCQAGAKGPLAALADGIAHNGTLEARALTAVTTTGVADTSRNPDNRIMAMPHLTTALHLRPDLLLNTERFTLSLKPRAAIYHQSVSEAGREYQQWSKEIYVQQWLARWQATDALYFSYGRENLQWGPASLTSLSNPFFADNGKSNPKLEIGAMDFARTVWVPNPTWSVSLIATTDQGRGEAPDRDFQKSYAIKADYTGSESYSSLILTSRGHLLDQIGGYYGRTVSNALLVYSEGAILRDPPGLYPEPAADDPLGYQMRHKTGADDRWVGSILAGAAYTLASGPTLTLEYMYYGPGYDHTQAGEFFSLQDNATRAIQTNSALSPLAFTKLASCADPGLRFLRRNYLMLQYTQTDIGNALDLTLRWTQNLDDGSARLSGIAEWYIGDHVQLFAVTTIDSGCDQSEFGNIIDYQVMLGVLYFF